MGLGLSDVVVVIWYDRGLMIRFFYDFFWIVFLFGYPFAGNCFE